MSYAPITLLKFRKQEERNGKNERKIKLLKVILLSKQQSNETVYGGRSQSGDSLFPFLF